MIKNAQKQRGSTHVVIIIILVLALLGVLGFIFWQNFVNKNEPSGTSGTATSGEGGVAVKPVTYKTYTTDVYGFSFEYPDTWTLSDPKSSDEEFGVQRSITVNTAEGNKVVLDIGIRGIGGTCDMEYADTYKVIDTTTTSIPGTKPVNFSLTLQPNDDGTFDGYFGLTNHYVTVGDTRVCSNVFYYLFSPTNNDFGLISFRGIKSFSTVEAASAYTESDEYRAIKKMVSSLKY